MLPKPPTDRYLDSDTYLLALLARAKLIDAKQRDLVVQKKEQQRDHLLRASIRRRKSDGHHPLTATPDMVDVIASFNFETPEEVPRQLTDELIIRELALDLKIPFKKLDPLELNLEVVTKTIPKSFALKHLLLPFEVVNGVLGVAIHAPESREVLGEIERANQIKVKPYLSTKAEITKILAEFFGFQSSISAAENNLATPGVDLGNLEQYVRISSTPELASSDQHIKGAVDHLFNYAFEQHASDIHIEPKRSTSLIRLRIDGVLHTIYTLPKVVHPAIISRVKSLSRLDIAEKRRPQDGRIKVAHGGKEAEIRVSTIPVAFGEKAVLRILDPDILFQEIRNIGFSEADFQVYHKFMEAPHGIVLVTGPTGSGKSTTLYSTLKNIATPATNIITVEDPVEMVHEEFNQISVQPQVELTFSSVLRNILRQDPDIIMIGEIRDAETAKHATQAALTGHLVFSTLHTNDAISSVSRLLDLEVQPFLIASTLLGAMAQRLVRTICPHCAENFSETAETLRAYGFPVTEGESFTLRRGKGCQHCRGTGYLGRCGIFEIFPISAALKRLISSQAPEAELRATAIRDGMTPIRIDAWEKVKRGLTTPEEAIRIIGAL